MLGKAMPREAWVGMASSPRPNLLGGFSHGEENLEVHGRHWCRRSQYWATYVRVWRGQ
jgi:hypothetical protein